MRIKDKNTGASMAVAFLFMTIASVPVSLRAVGIEVSVTPGSVVSAWGQVAGIVVGGYQPLSAIEWAALNGLDENGTSDTKKGSIDHPCIAGLTAMASEEACETDCDSPQGEVIAAAVAQARCGKSTHRQMIRKRIELARARMALETPLALTIEAARPAVAINAMYFNPRAFDKDREKQVSRLKFEQVKATAKVQIPRAFKIVVNLDNAGKNECEIQRALKALRENGLGRKLRHTPADEMTPVREDSYL